MNRHQNINPLTDMDSFIRKLHKEDKRYYKLTRNVQWLMWIMVPLYAAFFLFNPDKGLLITERIGGLCYVIAFVIFALVFRKFNMEFKTVDYGVPVVEMLKLAAKRYSLYQRKLLLIIAPVLFIDAGMVLLLVDNFGTKNLIQVIVWAQLSLFSSLLIGLIVGYLIWRKRQKPLRDTAFAMLKELES